MRQANHTFLYDFLPAVYRQQDQEQNLSLQNLLSVMEEEFQNTQAQIDKAYANCFIETCEPWVEAYIADLLGIQGLHDAVNLPTQRARIANTIRYRRRKGQQRVLERIISDVTGWRAHVVEYAQLLGMTQYLQHVRPGKGQTMNIRDLDGVDTLATPFEVNAHLVDVRTAPRYPAKFNINNLGLFICRLVSYPISKGYAYAVDPGLKQYTFNPLGLDSPLFNNYQTLTGLSQATTEISLPIAIRPLAFQKNLANSQKNNPDPTDRVYYGENCSFYIKIVHTSETEPVLSKQIVVADLSQWTPRPPLEAGKVAIDVKLGRFMLGNGYTDIQRVTVNYNYGFSAPLGGGHYDRQMELRPVDEDTVYVPNQFPTLQAAITFWQNKSTCTTIQIEDDSTYILSNSIIENNIDAKRKCVIQAANNTRPCLRTASLSPVTLLELKGGINDPLYAGTDKTLQVELNGLLIDGLIELHENVDLTINHCTLVPKADQASLSCAETTSTENNGSRVTINHSITGPLYLCSHTIELKVADSIIDAQQKVALAADTGGSQPGPNSTLERTTVFGSMYVAELVLLSNSIITGLVATDRTQTGTVRFSYLPFDSETPSRYQCLPDLDFIPLAQQRARDQDLANYTELKSSDPIWWNNTLRSLEPQFTSVTYGNPSYAQLKVNTPQSVLAGADDGSEMGCFQTLNQTQRQKQLQTILDEYLPVGLTAGVFYAT